MNRLYVAETTPTSTGSMADHRLAVSTDELFALALAIGAKIGVQTGLNRRSMLSAGQLHWATAVAEDLSRAGKVEMAEALHILRKRHAVGPRGIHGQPFRQFPSYP